MLCGGIGSFLKPTTRTQHQTEDQSTPSGSHMDDRPTGEIDRFDGGIGVPDPVHEPGNSPHHVGHREVDQKHPEGDEKHQRPIFHSFGDRAHDECRRDDREHQLVHRIDILRDPVPVVRVRGGDYSRQEEIFRSAVERTIEAFAEDQAITEGPPENRHQPGDAKALSEDRQNVFSSDQAAVKQRQSRQGHEQHQGRGSHHPSVMPGSRRTHRRHGKVFGNIAVLVLERGGGISVRNIGFQSRYPLFQSGRRRAGVGDGAGAAAVAGPLGLPQLRAQASRPRAVRMP